VVFLSRHDQGHRLSPSDINYRANVDVSSGPGGPIWSRSRPADPLRRAADRNFRGRPVRRPHPQAASAFFRQGLRGACSDGHPVCRGLRPSPGAAAEAEGHHRRDAAALSLHGRTAILHARESLTYKGIGYSVGRHDQHAGGQAARERRFAYATVGHVTDSIAGIRTRAVTVQDIIKVLRAMPTRQSAWSRWQRSFRASQSHVRSAPTVRSYRDDHRAEAVTEASSKKLEAFGPPPPPDACARSCRRANASVSGSMPPWFARVELKSSGRSTARSS